MVGITCPIDLSKLDGGHAPQFFHPCIFLKAIGRGLPPSSAGTAQRFRFVDFDKKHLNIHTRIKPFFSSLPNQLERLCLPHFYSPILTFSDPMYILYGHFLIHQICISLLWTICHMVFLHSSVKNKQTNSISYILKSLVPTIGT